MTAFADGFVRDVSRTALLVIDMQNDFLLPDAPVCTPGGMDLVPVIADLAQAFRSAALPVAFTQEMHRPDMSDFGIELHFEPIHCLEGSPSQATSASWANVGMTRSWGPISIWRCGFGEWRTCSSLVYALIFA